MKTVLVDTKELSTEELGKFVDLVYDMTVDGKSCTICGKPIQDGTRESVVSGSKPITFAHQACWEEHHG